jgi:hypothetical protein
MAFEFNFFNVVNYVAFNNWGLSLTDPRRADDLISAAQLCCLRQLRLMVCKNLMPLSVFR